ncbi:hypothetical protein RBH29_09560 [Herbivorax sp. ANBcel31]|uniref:hypothetical protein n=1 Tax=Herbivorax sp. ANBcel31 TaxID=3069754 RepID=UPI0027AEE5DD|nr:hypothetical protein [Herbivorax sp. ANBcel31]MDQ2086670.1 hypothetical protein [Herbivorax sp. ANBcel31]
MDIKYMPDEKSVIEARIVDDPLLILISHDANTIIMGNIDYYAEHLLLLKNACFKERQPNDFFRIIATNSGADWTFVAPYNYKNIENREKRIEAFYNDGIKAIAKVLDKLQFGSEINIPKRYQRHLEIFKD